MELAAILGLGLLAAAISGRVTTLALRGGITRPLNALNAVRDAVGFFAGLCFWALVVWGFSSLDWYIVIPLALVAGAGGGIVANPPRTEFFYRFEPVADLATLIATSWLWIQHWPY